MGEPSTHDKLKEIIAMAKKNPNFGLALGKSATDEPVILANMVKNPEALEKTAKQAAGGNRTGCGTLDFKGGALVLHFAADPPKGCMRVLKKHFKDNRITAKLVLVLPCGTVEDEYQYNDDEQAPTDAPRGRERSDADAPPPDPAMLAAVEKAAKLMAIFDRTRPLLAEAAKAEPAKAAVIDKLQQAFDKAAAATPPDVATMEKIAAAAQQQLPKPKDGGEAAKLTGLFKTVATGAMPHAKADPAIAKALRDQSAAFKAAIGTAPPDLAAAKAAIDALQARIPKPAKTAAAPPSRPPPDRPPPDTPDAPVKAAHGNWSRGFNAAGTEVGRLQAAIRAAAEGAAGIDKVDKAFGDLRKTLAQLDTAVTAALLPGIGTGEATRIAKARKETIKLAGKVEKILGSHPILSKIDDNPFVPIRAAAGLRQSLAEMRRDLGTAA